MNILVVNPPNKPFTNPSILAEPIDVLQIATIIKEKYSKVRVIDMDVDRLGNNINKYLSDKNIVIFVYDYQLPLHTSHTIENIFEIIKTNQHKNTKYIIIGKSSSFKYEYFLNNGIDVVIRGISENIINDVIQNINNFLLLKTIPNIIFKEDNKIIKTRSESLKNDFKNFPQIDRNLIDINKYMDTRTMITSRGCISTCKFCSTPYYFGLWNGKSVDAIIKEIEMLIENYNTKKIIFLDDNMTVDKNRIFQLCYEIKKRNIKCLFGCLSSIKCYDKKMFEEMYKVGFRWVHFGIESGSTRILKLMNKDMDINYIKQVIQEVKDIGYRVRTSFILDYPTSTKQDLILTKELILSLQPHELRLHYLAYRLGTPIYNDKNILNKSQYIHNNKPNIKNKELEKEINDLVISLKENNYNVINNEIDWNIYNNKDKSTKIVAFTPIKYGMCWYE